MIEGTVDFPENGGVLVIAPNASDTFARASIVNGKFKLTGSVDSIVEAAVILEGQRMGSFPFFLENSKNVYHAELHLKDSIHDTQITGGGVQNIAALFRKESVEILRFKLDPVVAAINQANLVADYKLADSLRQVYQAIVKEAERCEDSLLDVYHDNYVAAYLINMRCRHDKVLLKEKSKILGPNAWNTTYGKVIKSTLSQYEKLSEGKVIPDFRGVTPTKDTMEIHKIAGKLKLINFWASWSDASCQENIELKKLYDVYHDKGFEIINISIDIYRNNWVETIRSQELPWVQLADFSGKNTIINTFIISSVPTNYLVDSDNVILKHNVRGKHLQKELQMRLDK